MSYSHPDNNSFKSSSPGFAYQYRDDSDEGKSFTAPPRRRGGCFCACCLGCCGFLLIIGAAIAVFCYYLLVGAAPLIVSEETTIIIEPLKSDGTVDFHEHIDKALNKGVQFDENGFRDVLRGFGSSVFLSDDEGNNLWQYSEMCKKLEIDPNAPLLWHSFEDKGLDAVHVATAKPHYHIPLVRQSEKDFVLLSQPLTVYAFHEQLSNALRQRAEKRFKSGDTDGAWKDTLASIRLFRQVTVNSTWQATLIGQNADSLLTPVSEVVATLEKWTPEQLKQAIEDLESLPDWQDRQTTLQTMQFCLLDFMSASNDIQGIPNRLGSESTREAQELLNILQFFGFDWNLVAIEMNRSIKQYEDDLRDVADKDIDKQFERLRLRPIGEAIPQIKSLNDEELQKECQKLFEEHFSATKEFPIFTKGRSNLVGKLTAEFVKWAAGEMFRLQLIEESRCQALRLALALELFHKENDGRYPDSLEELCLKPMKVDILLQYEKRGAGYQIYNKTFQQSRNR